MPANFLAWRCWWLVYGCRIFTFGGAAGFDWAQVERVLLGFRQVTPDEYDSDLHWALSVCADEMQAVDREQREQRREEAEASTSTASPRRRRRQPGG
jgi:hypothetical protein